MKILAEGLLWYIVFIISTTFHEASHAFAALKLGDRTAYEGGHVTLDPLVHIKREPLGTVVVPLVSFLMGGWMIGWASVPFDIQWAYDNPRASAKMSAAGPAANLFLVILSALTIRIGIMAGIFASPESVNYDHIVDAVGNGFLNSFASFINVFFCLNLILFIFNLIPLPPLDGSGILPLFLNKNQARNYIDYFRNGAFSIGGLVIAWFVFDFIYGPIHLLFVNILYYPIAYYQ
jgi:Zn-dependent protease